MIISDKHKFIFIHVYRTGGSSVDQAFGGNMKGMNTHTKLETIPNWQDYFSFGFVRNPWDRTLSSYHYQTTKGQYKGSFDQYVQRFAAGRLQTEKQYAQRDMLINCTYVGRFEHLQEDFNECCTLIGIPKLVLPHKWKTNHRPYQEMYTEDQKRIIGEANKGDIEHFGFTFEGPATENIR